MSVHEKSVLYNQEFVITEFVINRDYCTLFGYK